MSTKISFFACFLTCMLLSSGLCTRINTYVLLKTPDNLHRFSEQFLTYSNVSCVQCTAYCDQHPRCMSVNHNSHLKKCELNDNYPIEISTNYASEIGWKTYNSYKAVYERDLMTGAISWQSSTYTTAVASRALDGNTDGKYGSGSCTHTGFTGTNYWAMEFGSEGPVGRIIFYFRINCCAYRNRLLYFLVSRTRHDVDNDVGTMCATYVGPPSDPEVPATITCEVFAYGRYLKVIQGRNTFYSHPAGAANARTTFMLNAYARFSRLLIAG